MDNDFSRKSRAKQRMGEKRDAHLISISQATGKTVQEIEAHRAELSERFGIALNVAWYTKFGFYEDGDADARFNSFCRLYREIDAIKELRFLCDHRKLRESRLTAPYEALVLHFEQLLSPLHIAETVELLKWTIPRIENDATLARRLSADIEAMHLGFGFLPGEYVIFDFANKNLHERRSFTSGVLRMKWLRSLSDEANFWILNDKYNSYLRLKDLYKRDAIAVDDESDLDSFCAFCKGKDSFVRKLHDDSFGRGVALVDLTAQPAEDLFFQLLEETPRFIAEELICSHPLLQSLNSSSVNTVRIVTYLEEGRIKILDCFMKVGREGSFVDNGGSGGILIGVDSRTGTFKTDGVDERGIRYDRHPDNGSPFQGFQLPAWKDALALAQQAAFLVPEIRLIGWDLAYTSDCQWIIVEGNSSTQFIGQQATWNVGNRFRMEAELEFGLQKSQEKTYISSEARCTAEKMYRDSLSLPEKPSTLSTLPQKLGWLRSHSMQSSPDYCSSPKELRKHVAKVLGRSWNPPKRGAFDNATLFLCFCANGKAMAVGVPSDVEDYESFTWYKVQLSGLSLVKGTAKFPCPAVGLVAHVARAAAQLSADLPFALVAISARNEKAYIEYVEPYPSIDLIKAIPLYQRKRLANAIAIPGNEKDTSPL